MNSGLGVCKFVDGSFRISRSRGSVSRGVFGKGLGHHGCSLCGDLRVHRRGIIPENPGTQASWQGNGVLLNSGVTLGLILGHES